jgi:CDP-2,3-bis-(O-geranylgeranyl)-sn-glycerol synthase
MWKDLLFVMWLYLPVGLANMTPVFTAKINALSRWYIPIDGKRTFRGKRLLGDNKTWLGLVFGIIIAGITVAIQQQFHPSFVHSDYYMLSPITFGFLSGFGALGGDALESFFKRQLDIPPGQTWFPFDQIDYILGGILCTGIIYPISWYFALLAIAPYFLGHIISTNIGYMLKLKKSRI